MHPTLSCASIWMCMRTYSSALWHNTVQYVCSEEEAHFMKTVPQLVQASSSTVVTGMLVMLEYEYWHCPAADMSIMLPAAYWAILHGIYHPTGWKSTHEGSTGSFQPNKSRALADDCVMLVKWPSTCWSISQFISHRIARYVIIQSILYYCDCILCMAFTCLKVQ